MKSGVLLQVDKIFPTYVGNWAILGDQPLSLTRLPDASESGSRFSVAQPGISSVSVISVGVGPFTASVGLPSTSEVFPVAHACYVNGALTSGSPSPS